MSYAIQIQTVETHIELKNNVESNKKKKHEWRKNER